MILVFYDIIDENVHDISNVFELESVQFGKEVFLNDIMNKMKTMVGCNYTYFVAVEGELILLKSPSSLVPVDNAGHIKLSLFPSVCPPTIPSSQSYTFSDASRQDLYAPEDYHLSSSFANTTFRSCMNSRIAQQEASGSSLPLKPSKPATVSSSTSINSRPAPYKSAHWNSSPETRSQLHSSDETGQHHQDRPKPYRDGNLQHSYTYNERDRSEQDYKVNDEPNRGYSVDKSRQQQESGSWNYTGENAAAALGDAASLATSAAKSLFSFAKSVTVSTVAAVSSMGGVGITSTGVSVGSAISVGQTKVTVSRLLAEGGFGIVFMAEDSGGDMSRPRQYALKQLLCQSNEQTKEAQVELESLKRFQGHPNIIPLYDYCTIPAPKAGGSGAGTNKLVFMLFPLFSRGTAWDAIERAGFFPQQDGSGTGGMDGGPWPFPEKLALHIIRGLAEALLFIHSKGYTHRDVKPHNILLADNGPNGLFTPVVMDLGSVSAGRVEVKTKQHAFALEEEAASKTSAAYRAPELTSPPFPSSPYTIDERVDTFGLGCTLFCLAYGRSPFETAKEGVMRLAILNGKYAGPPKNRIRDCIFSDAFMQLIEWTLKVDWLERATMQDVLNEVDELLSR